MARKPFDYGTSFAEAAERSANAVMLEDKIYWENRGVDPNSPAAHASYVASLRGDVRAAISLLATAIAYLRYITYLLAAILIMLLVRFGPHLF